MSDYEPGDTMVEALRRANPVPADQPVSRRSLPSAHALFADVIAQRPRRVRRRVLVLAIVIALLALTLMAVAVLRRSDTSLPTGQVCYGTDSLRGPSIVSAGGDPEKACTAYWRGGRFGPNAVPDFDVCVLPSGVIAVFPGEAGSVCSQLDLPESSGDNRVERFVDAVNRKVSASCYGLDEADRIIKSELARRGIADWKVLAGSEGFSAKRPCASIYANAPAKTITVIAESNSFPTTGPAP